MAKLPRKWTRGNNWNESWFHARGCHAWTRVPTNPRHLIEYGVRRRASKSDGYIGMARTVAQAKRKALKVLARTCAPKVRGR